jgi:hypothetical protein
MMMKKISQKTVRTLKVASVIGVLLVLSITFTVYAEVAEFVINWWTVDGGGDSSQGGDYTLYGTIGQSDAGAMSGGGYTLHGGFWPGGALLEQVKLYLPLVMR